MQPLHLVTIFLIFITFQNVPALMLPIAGDSSAVWTAIDLLPTENKLDAISLSVNDTIKRDFSEEDPAAAVAPSVSAAPTPVQSSASDEKSTTSANSAEKAPASAVSSAPSKNNATRPNTENPENATTTSAQTEKTAVTDSLQQQTDSTTIVPGTIIITCIPDSVQIIINEVSVGRTPYNVFGFYPGIYDITLKLNGYVPFMKTVELKPGGTEFITGNLVRESGYLFISSTPENATVSINDTIVGMTPFTSKPLAPGIYSLQIDLPKFNSYSEQLGISPGITDSLHVPLSPAEKPGIFDNVDFKGSQKIRRITFGAICLASTVAGVIINSKVKNTLEREQSALEQYLEARLSEPEYAVRYDKYKDLTRSTNNYSLMRNICYGLGITGGAGLLISIPF